MDITQYKYMHVQRTLATSKHIAQHTITTTCDVGLGPTRLPILDTPL